MQSIPSIKPKYINDFIPPFSIHVVRGAMVVLFGFADVTLAVPVITSRQCVALLSPNCLNPGFVQQGNTVKYTLKKARSPINMLACSNLLCTVLVD